MFEMSAAREDHWQLAFIARVHDVLISPRPTWLDNSHNASIRRRMDGIGEREKGI